MRRLGFIAASLTLLASLLAPALAAADVNLFTVTDFHADQTLSRSDPQGSLHIIERINLVFTDNNHGILRAIPDRYKGHSLQLRINKISSDSRAPVQYSTYGSNGNTVIKVGDPNRTVTGPQEYTLDYTVRNVVTFYKDHDELYWDVNGDQWQQPFDRVSVTLHLPKDLLGVRQPICYTGGFGSTAQDCTLTGNDDGYTITTTKALAAGQTLTYVAGFSRGYFRPSSNFETASEYSKQIIGLLLPVIILGGGAWLHWLRRGRDPRGTGIIVPQYDPPDQLRPLAVGTVADFTVDNRDITATIIDLAIRKYIQIVERKKNRKLGKDTLSYQLILLNPDTSGLDSHETLLLNRLFPGLQAQQVADLSKLKNDLYKTASKLRRTVKEELTKAGYFRSSALSASTVLRLIVGFIIVAVLVVYGASQISSLVIVGTIIGVVIGGMFWGSMDARTAKGVAAKEHIEGLKLYLNVAEKDRLAKLQSPDAAYAASADEPVKTVELFEKLLPYAMVLGVERGWASQFNDLYTSPPDWYSGNWQTFNAAYFASSLNEGVGGAMNAAFSAPSSSSSSGFSGGGFSGGGGGGGGGGGW